MSLHFRLNKNLHPKKLLKDIETEIQKSVNKDELDNSILSIEVRKVSHIVDDTIEKIEHTLEELND